MSVCTHVRNEHYTLNSVDLLLKSSVYLISFFVEVCLKDTMSVADSLYNLQLIREFCTDHLQGCCPLVLEDLLYAPPILRVRHGSKKLLSKLTCLLLF